MNIDIEPVDEKGKKRYRLKVDGMDDKNLKGVAVGKTAIRIRVNELLTQV